MILFSGKSHKHAATGTRQWLHACCNMVSPYLCCLFGQDAHGIVAWLGKQVWPKDATRVVKGGNPGSTRHFVGQKCAQKSLFLSICMQALTVPWQLPQFPFGTDLKFKALRSGLMLCQIFFSDASVATNEISRKVRVHAQA